MGCGALFGILSINVLSVGDADYKHKQNFILDFVNDPIIADTNAVCSIGACEFLDAMGSGIGFKAFYLAIDCRDFGFVDFSEILFR